jgi:hypothetical protein
MGKLEKRARPISRTAPFDPVQVLQLVGIVAAFLIAVLANVIGARHYKRWDWTTSRRWSLSAATVSTLHDLGANVDVWVIVGARDPLEESLSQLLVSYEAETSKLVVHRIDPDRDTVQLLDLQRRFKFEAGKSQDGRLPDDAVVVVAREDKHWILTPQD